MNQARPARRSAVAGGHVSAPTPHGFFLEDGWSRNVARTIRVMRPGRDVAPHCGVEGQSMDRTVVTSIAAFLVVLALLVVLRARDSKFEVRPTDVVVAILPIMIFLLVTGKIQKLQVGELNVETAFVKASTSEIKPQVTSLTGLPSVPIRTNPKLSLAEIPRLLESRTQGLTFRLGSSGYDGSVIRAYLDALVKQPLFRYVIIQN